MPLPPYEVHSPLPLRLTSTRPQGWVCPEESGLEEGRRAWFQNYYVLLLFFFILQFPKANFYFCIQKYNF